MEAFHLSSSLHFYTELGKQSGAGAPGPWFARAAVGRGCGAAASGEGSGGEPALLRLLPAVDGHCLVGQRAAQLWPSRICSSNGNGDASQFKGVF